MRGNPRSNALAIFARHPSNWVVVGLILASGGYAFFRGGGLRAFGWGGLPLLGLGLFILNEYSMHRNVLHMPVPDPQRHPFLFRRYFRLHYGHHQNPADVSLLFAPVWFTVPMTLINVAVVALIAWLAGVAAPWSKAAAILFGSMCCFLYYEWVHMVAHIPHQPRLSFQKYMKKYHLWHHFRSEKYWFGVTNPSMDLLMRTYRAPDAVELSPTARRLGGVEAEAAASV